MANPSLSELKRKINAADDDDVSILQRRKRNLDTFNAYTKQCFSLRDDDEVSILRKGKRKLDLDRIFRRTFIKAEDCDPAALEKWHNRGGVMAVSDPTKYYARPFKPRVIKPREPSRYDEVLKKGTKYFNSDEVLEKRRKYLNSDEALQIRTKYFNSDDQESKSTDTNHDSKDHVSDEKIVEQ